MPPALKTRRALPGGVVSRAPESLFGLQRGARQAPAGKAGPAGGPQRAGPDSALIGVLGQSDAFGDVFHRQGQKADQIGAFFVVRGN